MIDVAAANNFIVALKRGAHEMSGRELQKFMETTIFLVDSDEFVRLDNMTDRFLTHSVADEEWTAAPLVGETPTPVEWKHGQKAFIQRLRTAAACLTNPARDLPAPACFFTFEQGAIMCGATRCAIIEREHPDWRDEQGHPRGALLGWLVSRQGSVIELLGSPDGREVDFFQTCEESKWCLSHVVLGMPWNLNALIAATGMPTRTVLRATPIEIAPFVKSVPKAARNRLRRSLSRMVRIRLPDAQTWEQQLKMQLPRLFEDDSMRSSMLHRHANPERQRGA